MAFESSLQDSGPTKKRNRAFDLWPGWSPVFFIACGQLRLALKCRLAK
jgi:hypothetical protein